MTLPKPPVVLPSDLVGVPNGRLPAGLLTPAGIPGNDWAMHHLASRGMRAMVAAMGRAGFAVRATGTYRTWDRQLQLFIARYEPCSYATWLATPTTRRKRWPAATTLGYSSQWWRKRLINGSYPATAAVPGTSNHGLGLAVDFAQELDGDPAPESVSTGMVQWLVANAATYGYGAELDSEPWHWRYWAGDRLPAAVIEFERGDVLGPTPIPTIREGVTGPEVGKLQQHLKWWGYYPYNVDSSCGPRTVEGIRQLQGKLGVGQDGIYGPVTAVAYTRLVDSLRG